MKPSIHDAADSIVSMIGNGQRTDARNAILKAKTNLKAGVLAALVMRSYAEHYAETGDRYGMDSFVRLLTDSF